MVHPLKPAEYARVKPLFETMDDNLAPHALVAGAGPGTIYVDDPDHPRSAIAQVGGRFFFTGDAGDGAFAGSLRSFFADQVYPRALEEGRDGLVLYYAPEAWEGTIKQALEGKRAERANRQYWVFRGLGSQTRALQPAATRDSHGTPGSTT